MDDASNRIADLELAIVDIRGEAGTNGKLGNLRSELGALKERIDKSETRRWQIVVTLLGSTLALVSAAILIGRWVGSVNTNIEQLKAFHAHDTNKDKP